jgi:hypothetical protein
MLAHLKLRLNIEDLKVQVSFLRLLRLVLLKDLLRGTSIGDLSFDLQSLLDGCDSRIQPLEAHSLKAKLSVFIDFALLAFI